MHIVHNILYHIANSVKCLCACTLINRAIYDAVTPRSDVDYSLSPPPRSSVRAACARTQVTFGPATPAPAPLDRPMDTG